MKFKNFINSINSFWNLIKGTFNGFLDDNAFKLSAALSYYTIFSLPPLLIIIIALSGIFLGPNAVRNDIFLQTKDLIGSSAALQIQETIKNVRLSNNNVFATTIGVIFLVIAASGVFAEIQESINYIWGIKAKPKRTMIKFLFNRLMSFTMIAFMGILSLAGLIINSFIEILFKSLEITFRRDTIVLIYIYNSLFLFIIILLLFLFIFKTLPDGNIAWLDSIIGACFTAFLFMIGKFAIGYYLHIFHFASVYGAAGSVILILLWVYYSAIILYFGAEFTKVYASMFGHKIIPNSYSIQNNN